MAHLHMPFLAEIGLALHDVAANELLGILGCLRYSGGCIAYQDASATLDAKALQTGIDTQVTDQILQQTFYGESYLAVDMQVMGITVVLRAPRCCQLVC